MENIENLKIEFIKLREEVVKTLIEKKLTISTCESATAGFIASNICDVPGASNILSESYVVYSNEAKIKVLHIDKNIIDKYGVVSKKCAIEMVECLYKITNSNICISITGNLGPDVLENKPSGLIYVGIKYENKIFAKELLFKEDRLNNKFLTVNEVFKMLKELVML